MGYELVYRGILAVDIERFTRGEWTDRRDPEAPPADDPVHRAVSRSHPVLREAVDRTRARLAAVADQPM